MRIVLGMARKRHQGCGSGLLMLSPFHLSLPLTHPSALTRALAGTPNRKLNSLQGRARERGRNGRGREREGREKGEKREKGERDTENRRERRPTILVG